MGNGSSKYFKSTTKTKTKHINKNGGRAGGGGVGSAAARVAVRQAKNRAAIAAATKRSSKKDKAAKATAGSVHERNSGTGVVSRPATVTKSTAKTTPNTDNKITKSPIPSNKVNRDPRGATKSAWQINADKEWNNSVAKAKATPKPVVKAAVVKKAAAPIKSGVDAGLLKGVASVAKKKASILLPSTGKASVTDDATATTNAKNSATTAKTTVSANGGRAGNGGVGSVAAKVSKRAVKDKAAVDANRSDLYDSSSRDKFINDNSKGTDAWKADLKATAKANSEKKNPNLSYGNETVAEKDKYNQAYWAKQVADPNVSQADIKKKMDAVGMKKAYSGAQVVSKGNKKTADDTVKRVTGSDATIQNGGVTRDWTRSGLLGEKVRGDFKWKDGTQVTTMANNPVLGGTFNEVTGRIDGGTRFGDYNSTTFAGTGNYTGSIAGSNDKRNDKRPNEDDIIDDLPEGSGESSTGDLIATASVKGGNDGLGGDAEVVTLTAAQSTTLDDILTKKVDIKTLTVDALTTVISSTTTVAEVDEIIAVTKDPEILKSLYKRRLSLLRFGSTRTRHAGLLDEADTKKSQMSIL